MLLMAKPNAAAMNMWTASALQPATRTVTLLYFNEKNRIINHVLSKTSAADTVKNACPKAAPQSSLGGNPPASGGSGGGSEAATVDVRFESSSACSTCANELRPIVSTQKV